MTSKHAAYGTGFSGAKLVVNCAGERTAPAARPAPRRADGPTFLRPPIADPERLDKERLMDVVAQGLNDLQGSVFTGCDLNTDEDDMEYLSDRCPYVLAGLNSPTDTNVAMCVSGG